MKLNSIYDLTVELIGKRRITKHGIFEHDIRNYVLGTIIQICPPRFRKIQADFSIVWKYL